MSSYKITGTIVDIKDEQQIVQYFSKREVWVELPGKNNPTVAFEFHNAGAAKLDDHSIGDTVEIEFTVRGKIYKDRCFNALVASDITLVMGTQSKPKPKKPAERKQWTPPPVPETIEQSEAFGRETQIEGIDDLPF